MAECFNSSKKFRSRKVLSMFTFFKRFNIVGFSLTARMLFDVRSCLSSFFISSSFARKNSVLASRYLIKNRLDSTFFKEWSKEISLQHRIHKMIPKPGADVKVFVLFKMLYILDVAFFILYFSSNSCSTCFGQLCAHHQELTTAWYYSLVLVCAVNAGRLSSPVGR